LILYDITSFFYECGLTFFIVEQRDGGGHASSIPPA
jgi:hypothetical protein